MGQGPVFRQAAGAGCGDPLPWQEGVQREPRFREFGAGSLVRRLPKHLWPPARQLSGVGLGAYLDSALGCHTPESGSVAFLPSFPLLISAGEATGQCTAAAA